jgi:predicted hydrocarbon binding protein
MAKKQVTLPRNGRIGRLARQVEALAGRPVAEAVIRNPQDYAAANPAGKAAWVKQTVERLEQEVGIARARAIMQACGRKSGRGTAERACRLIGTGNSLEQIVRKLNASGVGGGRLKLKNQRTIVGGYDRCYCGQVKQTREPFANTTYCHCSVGWYRQLFESVLGRPVRVAITRSIIGGARSCEFVISVGSSPAGNPVSRKRKGASNED